MFSDVNCVPIVGGEFFRAVFNLTQIGNNPHCKLWSIEVSVCYDNLVKKELILNSNISDVFHLETGKQI